MGLFAFAIGIHSAVAELETEDAEAVLFFSGRAYAPWQQHLLLRVVLAGVPAPLRGSVPKAA